MDIKGIEQESLQDEQSAVVEIEDREGNPYTGPDGSPVTISVLGSESKKYRDARDRIARRMLRLRTTKLEPEDIRRNRIEQAASAITDWKGWESDGKEFPFTPTNAVKLLSAPGSGHILDQIETAIESHSSFFTKPSPSSSSA